MLKFARIALIALWAAAIAGAVTGYVVSPESFSPRSIAETLGRFQAWALLAYLGLSVIRGFTLLPSTPLVLAGAVLFPGSPWLVLFISLAGIAVSSTLIYWFSELLGFAEYFETRKPKAIARIRRRLEHPSGVAFVMLWAFFPLVPTDAVCYVAGSTRMNFWKFIAAILIGESVLCSIYVFGGGWLVSVA